MGSCIIYPHPPIEDNVFSRRGDPEGTPDFQGVSFTWHPYFQEGPSPGTRISREGDPHLAPGFPGRDPHLTSGFPRRDLHLAPLFPVRGPHLATKFPGRGPHRLALRFPGRDHHLTLAFPGILRTREELSPGGTWIFN